MGGVLILILAALVFVTTRVNTTAKMHAAPKPQATVTIKRTGEGRKLTGMGVRDG
jgi:predicted peptidase